MALLLLVAAGLGAAAWNLANDRAALQSATTTLHREHAQLTQEFAALDRQRVALQRDLAEATVAHAAAEASLSSAERQRQAVLAAIATLRERAANSPPSANSLRPRPPSSGYYAELFSDPHYARVFTALWRQVQATRYAPFLGELSRELSPSAFASFQDLLVQKYMATAEVDSIFGWQVLGGEKRPSPDESFKVKKKVSAAFEDEIRQTYGDEVLNRLHAFESGAYARQALLDPLALRLSYSAAPLDQAQSARLVEVFKAAWGALAFNGPPPPVPDAFVASAQTILKPEQMAGLMQLKTELEASQGRSSVSIRSVTPPTVPVPSRPPGGG